jgi:hypothetical protein
MAYTNLNALDEVVVYDTTTGETVHTAHIPAGVGFAYDDAAIYYSNLDDANFMYRYSFTMAQKQKLAKKCALRLLYLIVRRLCTRQLTQTRNRC